MAGQATRDPPRLRPRRLDQASLVDDPHDEAGDVVVAQRVDTRHLGRLSTDQGAAGLTAGLGGAVDDFGEELGPELAGGEVVEEEQGVGAGGGNVVDAVVDQVDPDSAMTVD